MPVLRQKITDPLMVVAVEEHVLCALHNKAVDFNHPSACQLGVAIPEVRERKVGICAEPSRIGMNTNRKIGRKWNDFVRWPQRACVLNGCGKITGKEWAVRGGVSKYFPL